jgi:NADPH-dependent 2,4-dienoyl-CoA reductase/sulfur reductase-like enzyme
VGAATANRNLRWELETTVWGTFPVGTLESKRTTGSNLFAGSPATGARRAEEIGLALHHQGRIDLLRAARVLLAPGAYDLPVAFPGWTLPGVMTAGGVQVFLKSQRLLPGKRFLLAGGHPLQLILADQLLSAGGEIVALCFAQPRPGFFLTLRELCSLRGNWKKILEAFGAWTRLRRAGIPILFGTIIARAEGNDGVEGAVVASVDESWRMLPGTEQRFGCDTVALNYGFLPSTELARQAGCEYEWIPTRGGWVLKHDTWMRTSQPHLYAAGEITGVAGADVAEAEGRLAALGILLDTGRLTSERTKRMAAPIRRDLGCHQRFSRVVQRIFNPRTEALTQLLTDEVTLCRCEEIKVGALTKAFRENPQLGTADAVKLLTRAGMGLCQGRNCGLAVAALIAKHTGRDMASIGPFKARPPMKPVPLGDLADHWELRKY